MKSTHMTNILMAVTLAVLLSPLLSWSQLTIADRELFADRVPVNPWNTARIYTQVFSTNDCSVIEGCVPAGSPRRLLNFGVLIYNRGTTTNDFWHAPTNSAYYHFDPCHHHMHLDNFARFLLLDCKGSVVSGRKMGWCVQDLERLIDLGWNTNQIPKNCVRPVLTPGWSDFYQSQACMYMDITGIKDGLYTLWIELDPLRLFNNSHALLTHTLAITNLTVLALDGPLPCVPAAPSGFTAMKKQGVFQLAWTDNADNETRFEIEVARGSQFVVLAILAANTTKFNDTVSKGKQPSYRIRSVNDSGASVWIK